MNGKTDCNTASWTINCSFCLRHRAFDANKQTKTCGEKMPYLIDPNKLKINKNAHRFDLIVFLFERINLHTAKAKWKTIIVFFFGQKCVKQVTAYKSSKTLTFIYKSRLFHNNNSHALNDKRHTVLTTSLMTYRTHYRTKPHM